MANMTPAGERSEADLVRTLYAANVHPLWDRYHALIPVEPSATDAAMHWRWRDMEPLAERAAKEAPLEERRALMVANPAFGGETNTTANLSCGFTVLQPGDRAPRHRHTAPAIRFGVASDGAATIVNGRRCEMGKGDLVLTPPMCWHGHINESGGRTVWFDALGHPLTNLLDASFFEPGGSEDNAQWSVDEGDERLWESAGMMDVNAEAEPAHSPKFHYPAADARRLLESMSAGPDGSRTLRYLNPVTGGAVMHTLDCYMMRLGKDSATRPKRATHNAIVFVAAGEGRTTVGEQTFEWSERDVFTVPHWEWASHEAMNGEADLFLVTDRIVYERLGILREEMQ